MAWGNRNELSAPGFEDYRVQEEERDSETITRSSEATFPPLPRGEDVRPSRLLAQPKRLCRPADEGIGWRGEDSTDTGRRSRSGVGVLSQRGLLHLSPPHHCLALCIYSQPLASKLSCLDL